MSHARLTLTLVVTLVFCIDAKAQMADSVSIIRDTIESLERNSAHITSGHAMKNALQESRLAGQWTVTSSVKEGDFSTAQIGQELGDIISIGRKQVTVSGVTEVQVT